MSGSANQRELQAGDIIAPRARAWDKVLIQEVQEVGDGRLALATVYEGGQFKPQPPGRPWSTPPANFGLLPDLSDDSEEGRRELARYRLIGSAVVKKISDAKGSLSLNNLASEIATDLGLDRQLIEDAIRFRVGTAVFTLEVKPRGTGSGRTVEPIISISESSRRLEKRRRYAASLANEIEAQSRQIADLVDHGATTGAYRETLLRRLLERHLPARYHVATGFVYGCERQLDILIYDRLDHPVFFREGELVVVHADAVRAVIEVKTTLNSSELCGALQLMSELGELRPGGPPVFKAIFGFDGATTKTVTKYLRKFYRGEVNEDGALLVGAPREEQRINFLGEPVSVVCIRGRGLVEVGFERPEGSACYRPLVREVRNSLDRPTQMAEFLERLLAHLREPVTGTRNAPWLYPLISDEQTFGAMSYIEEDCDWGPYAGTEGQASAFEARLQAYTDWRHGADWQLSIDS